ncbi:hypothetical protein FUAX_21990 [Fulvitalea axinellae]|uniref:RagB/SusD family nutrient uptake outer membrane protein n=1 Tax=Fulvitalea axinellae TaxID=1182444 RepID=A0AAU9CS23_9BACT|nr:hypothetical protein FUAX_21990 [Fulvitalea axinellae]
MMKRIRYLLIVLVVGSLCSCEGLGFLKIKPDNLILTEDAVKTKDDVKKYLNSAYDAMSYSGAFGGNAAVAADVLADNVVTTNNGFEWSQIRSRTMNLFNPIGRDIWGQTYQAIDRANYVYDIIPEIFDGDPEGAVLRAECRFVRALGYYHLMQYFALPYDATTLNRPGVPVRLRGTQNIEQAATPVPRSTVQEVYAQIFEDLLAAMNTLPEDNDYYPNKWAAKSFLAKIYFTVGDNANALQYAEDVISNSPYTLDQDNVTFEAPEADKEKFRGFEYDERDGKLIVTIRNVELKYAAAQFSSYSEDVKTNENIFYLPSISSANNRAGGLTGSYRTNATYTPQFQYTTFLGNLYKAIPTDNRLTWLGTDAGDNNDVGDFITRYNFDYMNAPIISLNEVYLVASEAAFSQNERDKARMYLNAIQARTKVPETDVSLELIRQERRKELAFLGYRLTELKRQRSTDIRGVPWDSPDLLFQIPDTEQNGNPDIILN